MRFPELTCLDYFLWDYIINKVYEISLADIEGLNMKITIGFLAPDMLRSERRNITLICIKQNGELLKQLV